MNINGSLASQVDKAEAEPVVKSNKSSLLGKMAGAVQAAATAVSAAKLGVGYASLSGKDVSKVEAEDDKLENVETNPLVADDSNYGLGDDVENVETNPLLKG